MAGLRTTKTTFPRRRTERQFFDNRYWSQKAEAYREAYLMADPQAPATEGLFRLRDEIVVACMGVIEGMIRANHFGYIYAEHYDDMVQECALKLTKDLHLFNIRWNDDNPTASLFSFVSIICKYHLLSWGAKQNKVREREVLLDIMDVFSSDGTLHVSKDRRFSEFSEDDHFAAGEHIPVANEAPKIVIAPKEEKSESGVSTSSEDKGEESAEETAASDGEENDGE